VTTTHATTTDAQLTVRPLAGRIGAEISGVDASAALDDDTVAHIRQALVEHRVGFLRDQHLDYEGQVAFARQFGELTLGHPTLSSPPEQPLLEEIDSSMGTRTNFWHTDVTFLDRPVAFTMLRAVVIPELGGDTIWANTVAAYEDLSAELRELADKLRIVHTNAGGYTAAAEQRPGPYDVAAARRRQFVSTIYQTEHPAVRVHPETGEHSLLLGGFAQSVRGLSAQGSRDLIRILQDYVTRPENTVRWHWRVGDVAIWDNRSTQHYAIHDYGEAHRRGERVTVAGPVPVGVDGRPSVSIRGEASAYYAGQG
jgi:alpha-ketoglutarate-dependent sulfate ester dioxygenase